MGTGPRESRYIPSIPLDDDLSLALALAEQADELTQARFRARDLVVDAKPDRTPVTDADRAVERAVRATLAGARPGDAVIGEEEGSSGSSARRWIVDPIDGTKSFLRGGPVWATLLALEVDGTLELGVVSAPALGRRWWAQRGAGAFVDGAPIHVSRVGTLADAQLAYGDVAFWADDAFARRFAALAASAWNHRGFGDFWGHVLVAEGAVDVMVEPQVALWDLAAVSVIVEEAGGRFSDLTGRATADGGSALSTNGLLHDAALAMLRADDPRGTPGGSGG